jgi:prepilin-type processing-associated H-X9-DG protein/prepilin-type N-terminal cleavage/methylation domain-containing protein
MKTKNHFSGFSLVELLVSLAIVALLGAIATAAGKSVIESSQSAKCLSNLRTLGLAAMGYASDNGMKLPMTSHSGASAQWKETLKPYSSGDVEFRCPADKARPAYGQSSPRPSSYAVNDLLTPHPCQAPHLDYSHLSKISTPSKTIYFAELSDINFSDHLHFSMFWGDEIPPEEFAHMVAVERHGDRSNYLFADGHAESIAWTEVQQRLLAPNSRLINPTP